MEGKRLGRGEALRKLLETGSSGRTVPSVEGKSNAPPQASRPAGRSAIFASLAKKAEAPSQQAQAPPALPTGGRGKLLSAAASAPSRVQPSEVEVITSRIKTLSPIERPSVPSSPELKEPVIKRGTTGREVKLAVNYVRIHTAEGKGIFQYDVQFDPPVDSMGARRGLLKQCKDVIGETKLFDGHVMYLPFKMVQKVTVLQGNLMTDNSPINVIIKFVQRLSYGDKEAIHLYNLLFRRIMVLLGMAEHGHNFYDPNAAMPIPMHKLEVWPGYVTAVDEFEDGLMLNCDASHRVLRNQTVLELMQDLESSRRKNWLDEFTSLMLGQSVLTRYNNKVYRIDDISFNESPLDTFEKSNGEKMSFIDYYRQQYNLHIRETQQPLLKSKYKRKIKGKEGQLVSLVPELCYLTGITDEMRADLKVMKDITQCICLNPNQRQYAINKFVENIKGNRDALKILGDWGLSFEDAFIHLPGRVLPAEGITFGGNFTVKGNAEANWSSAANKNKALTSVEMTNWSVVCTKRDESQVMQFVDQLVKFGPQIGLKILKPYFSNIPDDRTDNYIRTLRSITSRDCQIVMAVLPMARNDKYSAIKQLCCVEQPVPSQVMLSRTVRKATTARAIVLKVALQMNCKLGGTLWSVHIPMKSTMVCGLDSYHDPRRKANSVGALVCSLNQPLTRWYSKVYFSSPGYELVDGLGQAMFQCLQKSREINNSYPEQIVLFRDGVSDGQIKFCREHEIPQIEMAFKRIAPNYSPKLLVVVVQKRINTRIIENTQHNQYGNPPAGTVLDHTVTRRFFFDFFLVSQHVTQGTVSPTHYVVVHNNTKLAPDQIQRLSYTLTHLYYNWPGTIRVPAPCQYAHKLAYLVGENIHKEASEMLADKLFYL